MKKSLIVIFILINFQFIGTKAELSAQPSFAMDTTFQPFFDVTGRFGFGEISTYRDGSRNYSFIGYGRSGMTAFEKINDSVFISGYGGGETTSQWTLMEI